MKKFMILAVMAAMSVMGAKAQEYVDQQHRADSLQAALTEMQAIQSKADMEAMNKKIWGRGRFLRLGYAIAQSGDDMNPVEKGKYGFFLTKGTTYLFPKTPLAGMVKIGLDAVWFDLQFTKYNSPYESMKWTSEFEEIDNGYDYDDDDDMDFDFNIGCMGLGVGMGIGPNVSVAPFALTSIDIMKPLRVSLYFHYSPTVQLYMRSDHGDVEFSTAFCNMMNFGGTLTYRKISLGIEGRWGKGKFKPLDFDSFLGDDDEDSLGSQKYTRRFANTRLYIQFAF